MPDTPGTLNFPTSLDTAVSLFEVSNRAYTTMTGSIGTGDLSIGVANGSLLPSTGAVTLVDSLTAPTKVEHIIFTTNASNTLTVPAGGRGFGGSTAQTWSGTVYVRARALAQHHSVLRGGVIALEAKLGINSSTPSSGTILRGTGAGASDWGALVNADVSASAAIALSKLAALTASRAVITDVSGVLSAAVTTSTEIGYLNGVTSAIQTQLDAKQASDADLMAIAGLSPSNDDVIQRKAGAWTNRTPTQLTADLIAMVGDSGSGGTKGLVPAPAAGDAAASKFLKADGTWAAAGGGLTVGATAIASGTAGRLLYEAAGNVLGEISGVTSNGSSLTALPVAGVITQTSASATAFESGPNGGTNPVFRLVNSTASAATGLSITGNAAGSGVTLTALSSGSSENVILTAKAASPKPFYFLSGGYLAFEGTTSSFPAIGRQTVGGALIEIRDASLAGYAATVGSAFYTKSSTVNVSIGYGFAGNGIIVGSGTNMGFSSNTDPTGGSMDTILRRAAAANLAFGAADAASPVAQTLSVQNVVGGTSNTAGANWTFAGSRGTGTGAGGRIIFQTAPAGSTGTTQNSLVEAVAVEASGTFKLKTVTFTNLPTAIANGEMIFVSDGAVTSGADNTLTSGGTGALAVRINGVWRAFNAQN